MLIGIKALGVFFDPGIFAARPKPRTAAGATQIRLNVQFPDSAIGGDDGVFFGLAVFRRHKAPDRLTSRDRGGLNNRRHVGAPKSGLPLKGNDPVVRRFGHCSPFGSPFAVVLSRQRRQDGTIAGGIAAGQGSHIDE
jgi:hypothetical protein